MSVLGSDWELPANALCTLVVPTRFDVDCVVDVQTPEQVHQQLKVKSILYCTFMELQDAHLEHHPKYKRVIELHNYMQKRYPALTRHWELSVVTFLTGVD